MVGVAEWPLDPAGCMRVFESAGPGWPFGGIDRPLAGCIRGFESVGPKGRLGSVGTG